MVTNEGVYLSWVSGSDNWRQSLEVRDLRTGWDKGLQLVKTGDARSVTLYSEGQIIEGHASFVRALRSGDLEPPFEE
ncbi:hypothetical protein ACLBXM_02320 [Xanthobacteraceae bacterium A53D]